MKSLYTNYQLYLEEIFCSTKLIHFVMNYFIEVYNAKSCFPGGASGKESAH